MLMKQRNQSDYTKERPGRRRLYASCRCLSSGNVIDYKGAKESAQQSHRGQKLNVCW